MKRLLAAFVTMVALGPSTGAAVTEYPCPSDPGFCYRDVADDGCFDSGVDEGPIDDEIRTTTAVDPAPPPGSVICPPSVKNLVGESGSMFITTPPGSSIRFYGKPKISPGLRLTSGGEILFSGNAAADVFNDGGTLILEAEDTVYVEGSTREIGFGRGIALPPFIVTSHTGNIIVGPKKRHWVGPVVLRAPAGNVTILEKVKFRRNLEIDALGTVHADGLSVGSHFNVDAASVTVMGKAKAGSVTTDCTGDVSFDNIRVTTHRVTIEGHNVTIGTSAEGPPRPSKFKKRQLLLDATGDVRIVFLSDKAQFNSHIRTTGSSIELLGSKINGNKTSPADYEITATGPASTCDLTGTTFKNVDLLVSCDTVIGP